MKKDNILNIAIVFVIIAIVIVGYKLYNKRNIDNSNDLHISLSINEISLFVDDVFQINAIINPENQESGILWSSSDNSIVEVDQKGKILAKKKGKANIKAELSNGKEDICYVTVNDKENLITSIKLDKNDIVIDVLDNKILKATILPNNASNKEIIWSSSDNSIVEVDQNGKILAKQAGKADIKVRTSNGKEDICHVTVNDNSILVDNISLNKSLLKVTYGSKTNIDVEISPSNATESLKWLSSNSKVVAIDSNGLITAKGRGTATITVESVSGKKATCEVEVEPYIKEDNYPYIYRDESSELTIEKKQYDSSLTGKKTYYYQIHLVITDYKRLHTALTYNKQDSSGKYMAKEISKAAKEVGAILALEGDCAVNGNYGSVRNGVFYSKNLDPKSISPKKACYGYYNNLSGVMGDCSKLSSKSLDKAISSKELTDSFRFSKNLLVNGKNQYKKDAKQRPRQANFVGYVKPGEFYFIVSEGYAYSDGNKLSDKTSYGLTSWEKGELLKSLGCTFGTQLDGGGSIIVWFRGKQLQSREVITKERDYLPDYVYFK